VNLFQEREIKEGEKEKKKERHYTIEEKKRI